MTTTTENGNGTETKGEMFEHPFEAAGLGRAPFRLVAIEERRGPIPMLDAEGRPTNSMVGSPGQPMGSCAYCATAIAECCIIRDADGKTFVVGNVCVYKTGDAALVDVTKREVNRRRLERKHELDAARIERVRETIARDDVRAALAAKTSPNRSDDTLLDWAEWMLTNAGTTGRIKVCRAVEKAAKEIDAGTADLESGRAVIADRDARRQRAADKRARLEAEETERKRVAREGSAWLVAALRAVRPTPFVDGIIEDLEDGRAIADLSPRCLDILRDIFGKTAGRGGSKLYRAKVAEFDEKVGR